MINRILIRIKVIQTLYSFLLVEKQFSIESNPSAPTKEKRFAYSLYLDMLVLLIKLSREVERRRGEYPLAGTRFISRLLMDERVKSLMTRYSSEPFPFDGIVEGLARAVKDSGVYKSFLKDLDRDVPAAEEMVWTNLLNMVVMPSPLLTAVIPDRVESRPCRGCSTGHSPISLRRRIMWMKCSGLSTRVSTRQGSSISGY